MTACRERFNDTIASGETRNAETPSVVAVRRNTTVVNSFFRLVSAVLLIGICTGGAVADENSQRLATWTEALDEIDEASGIGYLADTGCIFVSTACERAFKLAERVAVKYRRLANKSWRARGINLPGECFQIKLDGAQLDRVIAAYKRAQGQLQYKLYGTAYDLMGYGLLPWNDLECQSLARNEILRIRKLVVASAG